MTIEQLERKVNDLERQVAELRRELKPLRPLALKSVLDRMLAARAAA